MAKDAATKDRAKDRKPKEAGTKDRAKERKAKDLQSKIGKIADDLEQMAADLRAGRITPRKALKQVKSSRARWKKSLRK